MPQLSRASAWCGARAKSSEFGERLLGAAEAEQRVGVLIENGEVVAIERARLVEAVECFVVALERVVHLSEIGPGAGRARIDLDRGGLNRRCASPMRPSCALTVPS